MKGYKAFKADWTCRGKQYTCPGEFTEYGELSVCGHGMHFCENLADVFDYYDFFEDKTKVAEVEALGKIKTEGNKSCTNHLKVIREIPWDEVLKLCNTGNWNTGNWNTGNRNTGNCNTGNRNTGNWNTGDWNTGDWNTGNWNTGNRNTGNCNTSNWNTGNWNTGNWNTGNCNTGNWNTGNCNTGNWNTGNWNTGDWNKSSFNNGCFMTTEPTVMMFNKPSDWTYRDWLDSYARELLNSIPKNVVEWVYETDMTDDEKAEYPTYKITGGYLKVLDESECAQTWWNGLPEAKREVIFNIPNFDPVIFKECTGIDVGDYHG